MATTVQQQRRTAVPAPRTHELRVPAQRRADHDVQPPATSVPQLRGWGSEHDRTMARWMVAMMLSVSCYGALMVTLGTHVFG